MSKPVILALMQNMWASDPDRVYRSIQRYGEPYRRRVIAYALFAGCLSGKRLMKAFGPELCHEIKWDEASREISNKPSFVPTPDPAHIQQVIDHYQPQVILTFGKIALNAVSPLWADRPLISAPHPAARGADTVPRLNEAATNLRSFLDSQ